MNVTVDLPVSIAEDGTPRVIITALAPLMLTADDCARLCGFKAGVSVDAMIRESGFPLPVQPTGGAYRWRMEDVLAWNASLPQVPMGSRHRGHRRAAAIAAASSKEAA